MTAARHRHLRAVPSDRPASPPQPVDVPAVLSRETLLNARDGDPVAFAQLVRTYYPRCLRFAQHLLSSREDAEECVQDAFVRVHRALAKYQERDRFKAWLFHILANRCRTARSRARRFELIRVRMQRFRRSSAPFADPLTAAEQLSQAFAQLPHDLREAFQLRHVDGFSYEQISDITGMGVTAVRMRVSRAGARLRVALGL